MTETYRTPEDALSGLPDFPWEPQYIDWEGVRYVSVIVSPR